MLHKQNSYNTICTLTKCQNTIQYAPKTIVYGIQLALHNTGKWLNMSGFYLDVRKQCRDGI